MTIRVEYEDGEYARIVLTGNCVITQGQELDSIRDDTGTYHYFTKRGYYDGWGRDAEEVLTNGE